jgi:uncharacterized damage-inducible protein DinB
MRPHTTAFLFGSAMLLTVAARAADPPTVAKLYEDQIASVAREVVPLVEAMPADKFGFAPTTGEFKGVRTFAKQAKHIAAVNFMVAAAALGEKPPMELGGEDGPDSVATKEQVVSFLKDSYSYARKAAMKLTSANQTELVKSPFGDGQMVRGYCVSIVVSHSFDHYGQMVVYARMNGVVPPASR